MEVGPDPHSPARTNLLSCLSNKTRSLFTKPARGVRSGLYVAATTEEGCCVAKTLDELRDKLDADPDEVDAHLARMQADSPTDPSRAHASEDAEEGGRAR